MCKQVSSKNRKHDLAILRFAFRRSLLAVSPSFASKDQRGVKGARAAAEEHCQAERHRRRGPELRRGPATKAPAVRQKSWYRENAPAAIQRSRCSHRQMREAIVQRPAETDCAGTCSKRFLNPISVRRSIPTPRTMLPPPAPRPAATPVSPAKAARVRESESSLRRRRRGGSPVHRSRAAPA